MNTQRGFTLIEMVIVIILMGVLLSLLVPTLSKRTKQSVVLRIDTLTDYLASYPATLQRSLFCYEDCRRCDLYVDKKRIAQGVILQTADPIKKWQLDRYGEWHPSEPIFREGREGCFEFTLSSIGIPSLTVLQNEEGVVLYRPFAPHSPYKTKSLDDVRTILYDDQLLPFSQDDYYGSH